MFWQEVEYIVRLDVVVRDRPNRALFLDSVACFRLPAVSITQRLAMLNFHFSRQQKFLEVEKKVDHWYLLFFFIFFIKKKEKGV